ncbi:MAG: glycosyltransferase family 2 protein, partial [Chitinophagaceae bacterium]
MSWQTILIDIVSYGILIYSITIISSYILIGFYSLEETMKYMHKNRFVDYRLLAISNEAPSFSIIAPAYNEGLSIVD